MSISIHSETSKDEIETEDAELEDLVWNLMSRTGLLSQIQGQISKFIEDNGKAEKAASYSLYPERADGKILGFIFEYLQWIGMKQTNSVLLSESPVEVDTTIYESREEGSDYRPELCKILDEHNTTEGKGSPSRSHNYSRDEFEDSKLTSVSAHQSIKSDNEDEASQNENDSEDESYSSHKQSRRKSISKGNEEQSVYPTEQSNVPAEVTYVVGDDKPQTEVAAENHSADMISFNSPIVSSGFDQIRPHVTLRQKFNVDSVPDPFQSPKAVVTSFDTVPTVDMNNRLNFVQASNSLDEILSQSRHVEEAGSVLQDIADGSHSPVNKEGSLDRHDAPSQDVSQREPGEIENQKSEQKAKTKDPPSASQDEEESTSDFMDMLTMEDDTQDVSIPSDAKGMSSCEHDVSLKQCTSFD